MEKIMGTCPGCRKKCDLASPRCPIGEAYARTGVLPGGKKHRERKDLAEAQAEPGPLDDLRLAEMLRAVSRAVRHGAGTLDALNQEERAQLAALLDKAWAGIAAGWEERGRHHDHHDGGKHGHHGGYKEPKR
jgi:hypothetical protein